MFRNHKKINLNYSFVYFSGKKNKWRTNIKSVLTFNQNSFFLTKECRAEVIGTNPFSHTGKYEFLAVVDKNGSNTIRSTPLTLSKIEFKLEPEIKNEQSIIQSNVEYLSFDAVYSIVSESKPIEIFCEIEFEFENIKYNLTTKCEYINFSSKDTSERYLQPILGYVPFMLSNKLIHGYAALNIKEKVNGYLEFVLHDSKLKFENYYNKNLIKKFLIKIFNFFFFFLRINNFTKKVSIKECKITFFKYM